jgi:hypothetical protein
MADTKDWFENIANVTGTISKPNFDWVQDGDSTFNQRLLHCQKIFKKHEFNLT